MGLSRAGVADQYQRPALADPGRGFEVRDDLGGDVGVLLEVEVLELSGVSGSGDHISAGRSVADGVRNVDDTPVQASRLGLVQSVMSLLVATTSVRPEGENPAARSSE